MHGILLADKPEGITSNGLVQLVKRLVRPAKVGHSGTLDSAASGLMVLLLGAGTRSVEYLDEGRKTYLMQVLMGEETDTGDREGNVIRSSDPSGITEEQIQQALHALRGVIDQVPPHFSALKKKGVPLYRLARKGVFPELEARKVEIFSLDLLKWNPPLLDLEMICSKGTYARALARDLGQELNVGARLETLRRTSSGRFRVEDALTVDQMLSGGAKKISQHLISISAALGHIPDVQLQPAEIRKLTCGTGIALSRGRLPSGGAPDNHISRLFKTVSGNEELLILLRPEPKGSDIFLRPVKVFRTWESG